MTRHLTDLRFNYITKLGFCINTITLVYGLVVAATNDRSYVQNFALVSLNKIVLVGTPSSNHNIRETKPTLLGQTRHLPHEGILLIHAMKERIAYEQLNLDVNYHAIQM